ncbi:hypothetical protein DMI62_22345 [Escherichia coli]|nr:hypothetical protein [Escherichia coli]
MWWRYHAKFRVVKVWPSILQQIAIAKTEPGDENNGTSPPRRESRYS